MLTIRRYDDVIRFDFARSLPAKWRYWTTAYFLEGLMIDSGCAHTASELLEALKRHSLNLHTIVNTHRHEDHIGANGLLQKHFPALRILANPLALPVLADPRRHQPLQLYRQIFWGWPAPSWGMPVREGEIIEAGKYRLQVLETPGHTPDHICLYEPERGWLFSGDLFAGGRDRALIAGANIWQIIASLKRIVALPLRRLYPGSAQVRENPIPELQAKIAYLEELGEEVLALHRRGWSVKAIANSLLGKASYIEFVTGGHFSRYHLVLSYIQNTP